jgi:tRNA A37 threonylcarbamoyladenosine modification protein TsaB
MHRKKVDVLVLALSSPIMIGVYENQELIDAIITEEKSSEVLPILYERLEKSYRVEQLFYANGPGSFMAIKVAYIFLKSLSILKNIPLFATDAFYFNQNMPIKAVGKLYFVKTSDTIETKKFDEPVFSNFELPKVLNYNDFDTDTVPRYCIGAVG